MRGASTAAAKRPESSSTGRGAGAVQAQLLPSGSTW
jgi:hypothetical protein